jgi:hypothetical protein
LLLLSALLVLLVLLVCHFALLFLLGWHRKNE